MYVSFSESIKIITKYLSIIIKVKIRDFNIIEISL